MPEPLYTPDRRCKLLAAKLWLWDLLRYGPVTTSYMASSRQYRVFWARLQRDPELAAKVRADDEQKHQQGWGVTSSGYVVGSAGEFM